MKKNLFTLKLILGLSFLLNTSNVFSQSCLDLVTIQVDIFGGITVYPNDVLLPSSPIPGAVISIDDVSFEDSLTINCNDVYPFETFVITILDPSTGNKCTSIAEVIDVTPPVLVVQDVAVLNLTTDTLWLDYTMFDDGSYDFCGVLEYQIAKSYFTSADLGNGQVVFTVKDRFLNYNSTPVSYELIDKRDCIQYVTGQLSESGGQSSLRMYANQFSEQSDITSIEISLDGINFFDFLDFGCNDAGLTFDIYVQYNTSTGMFTCSSLLTVIDYFDPVINTVNEFEIDLDSASQVVTLTPNDVVVNIDEFCGNLDTFLSKNTFSQSDLGHNLVWLYVEDAVGSIDSVQFDVIVKLNGQFPVAACELMVTEYTPIWSGQKSILANEFLVQYHDSVTVSFSSTGNFSDELMVDCDDVTNNTTPKAVYVKTFDDGIESICQSSLDYLDAIPPVAVCDIMTILQLSSQGTAQLPAEVIDDGSYDACSAVNLSISQSEFDISHIGLNDVVLTVTDNYGNSNSCITEVTVQGDVCTLADNLSLPLFVLEVTGNYSFSDVSPAKLVADFGFTEMEVRPLPSTGCTNLFVNYTDQNIQDPNLLKVLRTWTILDNNTNEIVSYSQIIKIYTNELFRCIDIISVLPDGNDFDFFATDFLLFYMGNSADYDATIFVNGTALPNLTLTPAHVGQTISYEINHIPTGLNCNGLINYNDPISPCTFNEDSIIWPLPEINIVDLTTDPSLITPGYLVANHSLDSSEVMPVILGDCEFVGLSIQDNYSNNTDGSWTIYRTFSLVDWSTWMPGDEIYMFTQVITNGLLKTDLICDYLSRTEPITDCNQGHSLVDDVEWPSDIMIADYRILPAELVQFSNIDSLDSEPVFYNNQLKYSSSYIDILVSITATELILNRKWEVLHDDYDFVWYYDQVITIDLTTFSNLVTVETLNGRVMPQVVINNQLSTDENGKIVLPDNVDNISYSDDPLNGINILDFIEINDHILAIKPITDPNKLLMADIDGDLGIKASDLVELKKILFQTNESTWEFEKSTETGTIYGNKLKGEYIGRKKGDVNEDFVLPNEDPISHPKLGLTYQDKLLNKGQAYDLDFYVNENISYKGFELRLALNDISISSVTGQFSNLDWVVTADNDLVIFAAAIFESIDKDLPIINVEFLTEENSLVHNSFNQSENASYIVDENYGLYQIEPEVVNVIPTGVKDIEKISVSVYPNPTSGIINFDLSETIFDIEIYNPVGQLIISKSNNPRIDLSHFKSGLYYYSIKTLDRNESGHFILTNR